MQLYGAIDLHSNNGVAVILDERDQVVFKRRLRNDLATYLEALAPYRESLVGLAVESTYNWYWLVDGLQEAGYRMRLVNTTAVKVYDGAKFTDDEDDARHLAHLMHLGILPEGYIYPKALRSLRDLLRKRAQLVRQRTAQILSLQNLIERNTGKGCSLKRIEELSPEEMGEAAGGDKHRLLALKTSGVVLRCLQEQILVLEKAVLAEAKLRPEFEGLLTVDGIGRILALTIMLETGDIRRFATVGNYASYCRCVGSRRLSNGKKKGVGNRRNGNRYLSWAYLEAAQHAQRWNATIRRYFQRKQRERLGVVARKAVAHKLCSACYYVMRDGVPFDVMRAFGPGRSSISVESRQLVGALGKPAG